MKMRSKATLLLIALNMTSVFCSAEISTTPEPRLKSYDWMPLARWYQMHAEDVAIAEQGNGSIMFIGDSITECWAQNGSQIWNNTFQPLGAVNFGIGGDMTQNLLWRIDHGLLSNIHPEKIILLIGTNNLGFTDESPEQIAKGVSSVVNKLLINFKNSNLLLMAVFPRGETSNDEMRNKVDELNRSIEKRVKKMDSRVTYMDIGNQFLSADGSISTDIMADYLHLTSEGYKIWSDAIVGWLNKK